MQVKLTQRWTSTSIDVDAFATSTPCCDLYPGPLTSTILSSRSGDIVVTRSARTNKRGWWSAQKHNAFADSVGWRRHNNRNCTPGFSWTSQLSTVNWGYAGVMEVAIRKRRN